jgi:uncharacterized protein YkwD
MRTPRTASRALLVVVLLLLALLVPTGAQAAPPYEAQEQRFVKLINASRQAHGHRALVASPSVAKVARNWSKRMAADGNLRHNPNVSTLLKVDWRRWGENVGWASNRSGAPLAKVTRRLHRSFMQSRGHRANIMGDFNQVGVGVALDEDGTMWATVIFVHAPIKRRVAATASAGLSDIGGNTHCAANATAWRRGLMPPCDARRVCPTATVTRRQLAGLVVRAVNA